MSDDFPVPVLLLTGAGSNGTAWTTLRDLLGGSRVEPMPDLPTVVEMADHILATGGDPNPETVLVGASLGAMVAVEIARQTTIAGMVLIAAGPGVKVSPEALTAVKEPTPEALAAIAHAGVAPHRTDLHAARDADFVRPEPDLLFRHLTALGEHQFTPLTDPPATVVVWGRQDRSVGLGAHLRLAEACHGALRPLPDVGHSAYLEAPDVVAECTHFVHMQSKRRRHQ